MKFYSSIFALCLLQAATAFQAPTPQHVRSTSLGSTPGGGFGQPSGFNENVSGMNDPVSSTSGPLRNLKGPRSGADGKGKQSAAPAPVKVQGGSLRTWSFATPNVERVQVVLRTEGRPLNANIDLWQGPDNCPQKMAVYVEDGALRPFNSVIETPRGQNAIAIRNTATMEYPLDAMVEAGSGANDASGRLTDLSTSITVQGGAIKTYSFGSPVDSVQILLSTDGRPLNARVELLQGPNNNKQVIDLYTEDGMERPFYCVIETPGSGNVVRIINTAPLEFPLTAAVEPLDVADGFGGDSDGKPGWDSTNDASFYFLGGR